jgi:hypothetical protein
MKTTDWDRRSVSARLAFNKEEMAKVSVRLNPYET